MVLWIVHLDYGILHGVCAWENDTMASDVTSDLDPKS
jgi:hypothetical protein